MLGFANNIWMVTYIDIGLNIPFPTFLYCGFIGGIPEELDEAALIDGASPEKNIFSDYFPAFKADYHNLCCIYRVINME